ncbi:MAG: pyrroline-5-carboxylate reductase [Oxalobacter sp.]|nr:MAG: pyrroline-5-carboxylate reductase [Oxalobacter sp.]
MCNLTCIVKTFAQCSEMSGGNTLHLKDQGCIASNKIHRSPIKNKKERIMFNSIGFIGAGRVARIMLGGWQRANALPVNILAYDINPEAIKTLQNDFPKVTAATLAGCAACDLVFGAVHPPALPQVLDALAGKLRPHSVFCSLAPMMRFEEIQNKLLGFSRIVRLNPNSPGIVGKGYNPISFSSGLPNSIQDKLLRLFEPLGKTPEVDELQMETYAVVSAMGPTYFGFQFAEVMKIAKSFGLTHDEACEALRSMLRGTVDMLFGSNLPTEMVLDLVPVKPMAEDETEIRRMLQTRMGATHARLTG